MYSSGGSSLMRLRDKAGCHRGRGGKSSDNGLIYLLVSVTLCSTLDFKKMLANKGNSCSRLYVQLTVAVA